LRSRPAPTQSPLRPVLGHAANDGHHPHTVVGARHLSLEGLTARVRSTGAKYVLSELDSGERVISERLAHVRSVAIGFWIGAGSRDEKADRAASPTSSSTCSSRAPQLLSAADREIFDTLGGELNAATSREHTVVYARVPTISCRRRST
jgi:hypothetical protein